MLTFVVFLWRPRNPYRKSFGPDQVNIHRRMIRRHYRLPHRYVLITDNPAGITEPDIEIRALWNDLADVPNPCGHGNPSCYRRLKLFAANAGDWLGDRIVMMDLDCVILKDITPLFDRQEDFVIWENPTARRHLPPSRQTHIYNGGFWMLRTGTRSKVWETFDPANSPDVTRRAGLFGSDQAWLAHCLGPGEAIWKPADGVRSWKFDVLRNHGGQPPAGTRIVFFHGKPDPWAPEVWYRYDWVRENYR